MPELLDPLYFPRISLNSLVEISPGMPDDEDDEEDDDEDEDDGQSSVGISFGMSGKQSKLAKADNAKKVQQVTFSFKYRDL